MSENAALSAAGTYGNLFRAMGIGEITSAGMTTNLVKLAGDLASFNNMDPTEVLDKLRAGLSGETEPLRSLGVNLNAAQVSAKALSMGLGKSNVDMFAVVEANLKIEKAVKASAAATRNYGKDSLQAREAMMAELRAQENLEKVLAGTTTELTAAEKAQASYALIMEQTTLAQGDFARTSGGLANQQRILTATFENVKSTVGTALLPVVVQVAQQMNKWLSDPAITTGLTNLAQGIATFAGQVIAYIPQVIAWFQQMGDWLKNNQGVIVGILAGLGVAVGAFVWMTVIPAIAALITTLGPVILIMAAVGAAAYLLYQAWTTNFGGIRDTVAIVVAWIQATIKTFLDNVQAWWAANGAQVIQTVQALWQGIQAAVKLGIDNIKLWVSVFQAAFSGDWYAFGERLRVIWDGLWNQIKAVVEMAWPVIKTTVANAIESIKNFFTQTDWGSVGKNIIEGIGNGIKNAVGWLADMARQAAKAALDAAKGFLGIKSPSKVFAGVGRNMMLGMAVGIDQASSVPARAASQAAAGAVNQVTNITVNPHYYRGDEPSLLQELSMIGALARAQ
jgi:hypothetical protein